MAVGMSTTLRNNRLQQIINAIDAGAGPGKLRVYSGTRPATGGTATTLLAELTFSDPCAPAPANGVLTFSAITDDNSANATGTATWARIVDSDGNFVMDVNIGLSGSGAEIIINDVNIEVGDIVRVTSAAITEGMA